MKWFVGLLVLLGACTREPGRSPQAEACHAPEDRCRPPVAGHGVDGKPVADDAFQGKVVLVNFWATWCAPCIKELPALQKVYARNKDRGFQVVGLVSADEASDEEIRLFANRFGVSYPVVRASEQLESSFGLGGVLPTTFLYDRTGRLRRHWDGAIREEALEDEIRVLLQ
ncbi:MAG TPA: TlpA disulfide reductase family protein [Haliangiales bacterium]|nr:TlpA disulfide reductase family protein [Haliangiales bacterium]